MENIEEILLEEGLAEDGLQELKSWLFKENIRIMTASAELAEQREKFELEKDQFKEEMKNLNRKMSAEQSRIRKDNQLVDERLEIIKDGFRNWTWTAGGLTRSGQGLRRRKNFWRSGGCMTAIRKPVSFSTV